MKVLIVAATFLEIKGLLKSLNFKAINEDFYNCKKNEIDIDVLVSGIGIAFTVYALTKQIQKRNYDLVLNVGIAGSFNKGISIGELVIVCEEQFGDLGIENKNNFQTLFETGFIDANKKPFVNGKLLCKSVAVEVVSNLRKVKSITLNTVSGEEKSIAKLEQKFKVDIESMEGAAFFYVCLMEGVEFIQIRSISNYVEERNKENWDIPLAVSNLNKTVETILKKL